MRRSILIIAAVAVIGIGVCFLVIGTPAVTTVRIASKALSSAAESPSWPSFREVPDAKLGRLVEERPGDWKLRLLEAEGLHDIEQLALEFRWPATALSRQPLYEELIRDKPSLVAPRAAQAKALLDQDLDFFRSADARAAEERWKEMDPETRQLYATPPYDPYPARNTQVLEALEQSLQGLQKLEPDNGVWPCFLAYCSYARLDDEAAATHLKSAAAGRTWDLHGRDELEACLDAYAICGVPRLEATLLVSPLVDSADISVVSDVVWRTAIIGLGLAREHESEGRLREALELRIALIDVGRLMWQHADSVFSGLAGVLIVEQAFPTPTESASDTSGMATWEERRAAGRRNARLAQRALAEQLSAASMGELAPKYASVFEETRAYIEASRGVTKAIADNPADGFRPLGIAYSTAPLAWIALVMTMAAVIVVSIAAAPMLGKGKRASGRTVLGASITGGVACLGLLAASVIVSMSNSVGTGLLGVEAARQASRSALSPVALGLGILLATALSVWAVRLIERPPGSRTFAVLLSATWVVVGGAFLLCTWLFWAIEPEHWQARNTIGHGVLALVTVSGIVTVVRTWLRQESRQTSPLVPILSAAGILAIFSAVLLPLGRGIGPTWALGWNFAMRPHALVIGAIMVVAYAAVATSLFVRRRRRLAELFPIFAPISAAAFWGYAWFSWFPEPQSVDGAAIALHILLELATIGAVVVVWHVWARGRRNGRGVWAPMTATLSIVAVFSTLFISRDVRIPPGWPLLLVICVPLAVAIATLVTRIVAARRLPVSERPSYLTTLRSALGVCLIWILVLQFASLIWLGAWRSKAAAEMERAYSLNKNQAVLQIMEESGRVNKSQ